MKFKDITLETTNKVLSSNSGLVLFQKLWEDLKIEQKIKRVIPRKRRNKGAMQWNKVKSLLLSFALGNDSLSDLDILRNDELFMTFTAGGVSSRSMGDFLRSFNKRKIELLQTLLVELSIKLRLLLTEDKDFILTMDSTPHEHYSEKMEGMAYNYKNYYCLDSQNAYDQYGLSYLFDLRPGNTFSGDESELWIHKIFSKIPEDMNRYFRADSAYSKHVVFKALEAANAKFTIVLKDNIGRYVRKKNKNLLSWRKTNLYFFDSSECEVAMGLYPIKQFGTFRVVFIRAPKKDYTPTLFDGDYEEERYQHYSIITNISSFDMDEEAVINFYRKRANAENFIKEQKYGYDFLNFPCLKLDANRVYGLIGTLSYNLMRFLSFCMDQKVKRVRGKDKKVRTVTQQGYFSKHIRNHLIKIPCQVVKHARTMSLKLNQQTREVLEKVICKIQNSSSKVCYIQVQT